jgi:hypothetical protein
MSLRCVCVVVMMFAQDHYYQNHSLLRPSVRKKTIRNLLFLPAMIVRAMLTTFLPAMILRYALPYSISPILPYS